jgi:hypothetical protein
MRKFFKFAAVAAIVAMIASCGKEPAPGPEPGPGTNPTPETPSYTEDLTFTLAIDEVETNKAKIEVEHNGTTKDTWYGFATTESDVNKAIADVLAEGNVTLKKNTKTTITVRGLEPETEYTFIAVGIKADGTTYGEPATLKFTTAAEEVPAPPTPNEMTVNPNWTVTYSGAQEYDGQVYEHTATVTSTDQNPWFLSGAYEKEMFDAAVAEYGLTAIAQAELDGLKDYVDQINAYYGYNLTAVDLAYVGTDWDAIAIEPGKEYVVMAIGIGADSELSMLYAISDVISIEEEDLDEAYAAWLGNWTFTGANGLTQNVKFSKGIANQSYKMTGYEGQSLPVTVLWDAENHFWQINNHSLGNYTLTDQSGNPAPAEIWFLGKDAEMNFFFSDQLPICMGGMFEDGTLGCVPFEGTLQTEEGDFEYVVNDMNFFAYLTETDQISWISGTFQTGFPTFPITITPASATASTRSVENGIKHISKVMAIPCTFNSFLTNFNIR